MLGTQEQRTEGMTNERMTFPKTWEEYEKYYGFNDSKEVYTNNSRLIPSFRVKQWLDHLPSIQPKTDVIDKIRAEIEAERNAGGHTWYIGGLDFALSIIDKYMAESEVRND